MSGKVFGRAYAEHYDRLYGDKDYEKECNLLEGLFQRHSPGPVRTVLDLGCGTGSHAIPLAERGYRVTGVDRSREMLDRGVEKAARGVLSAGCQAPEFIHGDVRTLDLGRRFDVVLMMFAVLGYQLTNEDVLAALRAVRKHLEPGGLFICDVWYGPAVLSIGPSERIKVIPTAGGQIIRAAAGSLDTYHHLCKVDYHVWELAGSHLVSETRESHQMRYFFPQELDLFFSQEHLRLNALLVFDHSNSPPDANSWNVLVVASTF